MNLLRFLINSNIYISLAAVALTLETQAQLGIRPQLHPYIFIIFFATLFEYNLHRLVTVLTNKNALNDDKHKWVKNNIKYFYSLSAVSVIGFLCSLFLAKREVILIFVPIAIITIFYSLPFFIKRRNLFRLREIPGLKIFLIASVWSASTILLPVIFLGNFKNEGNIILMFIERFIFVFAITIPFDIRDMEADARSGLKTIPLMIGEKNSILVSNVSVGLFLMLTLLHYNGSQVSFIVPAFIVSGLSTLYFINSKILKSFIYYYYGILDGTLLLQGILVYFCFFCF